MATTAAITTATGHRWPRSAERFCCEAERALRVRHPERARPGQALGGDPSDSAGDGARRGAPPPLPQPQPPGSAWRRGGGLKFRVARGGANRVAAKCCPVAAGTVSLGGDDPVVSEARCDVITCNAAMSVSDSCPSAAGTGSLGGDDPAVSEARSDVISCNAAMSDVGSGGFGGPWASCLLFPFYGFRDLQKAVVLHNADMVGTT